MHSFRTLADADYYTREAEAGAGESWDYYDAGMEGRQEEAGVWHGALAMDLGLTGRIRKDDFKRLMSGMAPDGRKLVKTAWTPEEAAEKHAAVEQARRDLAEAERLARKELGLPKSANDEIAYEPTVVDARRQLEAAEKAATHRAGFDYTVSPPKAFTLALETAPPEVRAELDKAFDAAVAEVVEMIQERAYVRKGKGGSEVERASGIACATFKHRTSRPVEMVVDGRTRLVPDPQIHAHIVVANLSSGADGKTRTLTTDAIGSGRFRAYADAKTNAQLAQALRKRGIRIEPKELEDGSVTFQLAGLGEAEKTFSKRREQILAEEAKARAEGRPFDRGAAALDTRGKKLSDLSMADLREVWARDFKALGLTFEAMTQAQTADHIPRTDSQIVDALTTREVGFGLMDLERALWEEAQFYDFDVQARLDRIVRDESLLARSCATNGKSAVHRKQLQLCALEGEPLFVSKRQLNQQIDIGKRLAQLNSEGGAALTAEQAEAAIRKMEAERSTPERPFKLRADQSDVAKAFCVSRGFGALTAFAGTGKTTAAEAVTIAHEAAGFEVVGFAPSGKAADQFSVDTGAESFTFESFALRFEKWAREKKAGDKVLFMVDEAGMATLEQFDNMTKQAMELRSRGVAVKILVQGDVRQLPPVGAGAPFAWIVETGAGNRLPEAARLTHITRQFEDWAKEASYEASVGDFDAALAKYVDRGRVVARASRPALVRRMIEDFDACPLPAEEKILLAHRNDEVAMLNEMARKRQIAQGMVLADRGQTVPTLIDEKEGRLEIAPGDRIILRKNDRRLGVSNGQLATVGAVEPDGSGGFVATVDIDGKDKPVRLPIREGKDGYRAIERGYACTIHKSQGGTWKEAFMMHSGEGAELSLVAMTRHRAGLRIYTQEADRARMSRQMSAAAGKANPLDYLSGDEAKALRGNAGQGRTRIPVGRLVAEAAKEAAALPEASDKAAALAAQGVTVQARLAAELGKALSKAGTRIKTKMADIREARIEAKEIEEALNPERREHALRRAQLFAAARSGNIDEIKRLIEGGMDPFSCNRHGKTARQIASERGKKESAEYLAERESERYIEEAVSAVEAGRQRSFEPVRPYNVPARSSIFLDGPKPPPEAPENAQAKPAPARPPSPPPTPTQSPRRVMRSRQNQGLSR